MKEPSLLDYLRSLWEGEPERFQAYLKQEDAPSSAPQERPVRDEKVGEVRSGVLPLAALLFALCGQVFLEPAYKNILLAVVLYGAALLAMGIFFVRNRNNPEKRILNSPHFSSQEVRIELLFPALALLAAAFWFFQENRFTPLNVGLWVLGLIFFVMAVWEKPGSLIKRSKPTWVFVLLLVGVGLVSVFFRVYQLANVPSEMFSDHAEKLLDIADVLDGSTPIFFTRNTGREALQFYLTAALIKIFDLDISFLSLKLGTVLLGLGTLPFIYLIGRELGGRWVGLSALFLAGIAYWANVISRVALRYAIYPFFTAATFYFLIKALKTRQRNYFLLTGLILGLSLHGYSSDRFLPIVVTVIFFISTLHLNDRKQKSQLLWMFLLVAISAFLVFLPLFRYWVENPAMFSYRAATRLFPVEQPYPGNPLLIFLDNLWNALTMFFHDNGVIWVHSVPNRPALDVVSAALFMLGIFYSLLHAIRHKDWLHQAILASIPLLLMPSILSLVFPAENPSLNRPGGVYVLVFVMAGYAWVTILRTALGRLKPALRIGLLVSISLGIGLLSASQNYDLVFSQYRIQYDLKAWNTSELAQEIQLFYEEGGKRDHAFVVPYPHWVDTRLVGINAGWVRKDYALWPQDFVEGTQESGEYLFLLKPEDKENVDLLQALFPENTTILYTSDIPGKDFIEIRVKK